MRKINVVLTGLSAMVIVLLGIGISYSMWNMSISQDKINTVMTSCFDITYKAGNDNISLKNSYPISDEKGLNLTPYTFTITNNCDINAYYKINIETTNNSNIDNKFMKASLNGNSPKKINEYDKSEVSISNGKSSNTLLTGYLPVGGTESFDLRVWMDYDTTIEDINNDGTDKWVGKVVVVSSPVNEDEIAKACQDKGGDLVDSGECRKYYVKKNQQFNINQVTSTYTYNVINEKNNSFSLLSNCFSTSYNGCRFFPMQKFNVNHLYYYFFNSDVNSWFTAFFNYSEENYPAIASKYERVNSDNYYYYNIYTGNNSYFLIPNRNDIAMWYYEYAINTRFTNFVVVDLSLMFGEGNEPDKEWCDKYLTEYYEYNTEGTLVPIKDVGEVLKTSYYDVISLID